MNKPDDDVVDPAAYKFIKFIATVDVNLNELPVWKRQFLSGYSCFGGSKNAVGKQSPPTNLDKQHSSRNDIGVTG